MTTQPNGTGQPRPRPHKRQDVPKPKTRPAGQASVRSDATTRAGVTARSHGSSPSQRDRSSRNPQSARAGKDAASYDSGRVGGTRHAQLAQPSSARRQPASPAQTPGAHRQPAGTRPQNDRSTRQPRRPRGGGRPRRRGVNPFAIAAVAVVLVFGIGAFALLSTCSSGTDTDAAEEETTVATVSTVGALTSPVSTSTSDWAAGVMPHLYQIDAAWADLSYAGGTIGLRGCGPTCLAMVYIYLTGNTDMGVVEMCAFAEENGYATTGSTEWSFMTTGAATLGLGSEALIRTRDAFTTALETGQPIICSMQPGTFTKTGHFIVVADIDENGMCTVYDPNSSYRSAQLWPIQTILTECNMAWAYSLA